jgi:hypothetical protein
MRLLAVSVALAAWGLGYALHCGYYALGGTLLLPGTVADPRQFRLINAVAAVVLTIAAVLPIAVLPLWRRPKVRPVLLAVCWLVAVGCSMHALIDIIERVLSLCCTLKIPPLFGHRSTAEPSAGPVLQRAVVPARGACVRGAGWIVLGAGRRRLWVGSAIATTLALTVIGLLSATGVIGRVIIG